MYVGTAHSRRGAPLLQGVRLSARLLSTLTPLVEDRNHPGTAVVGAAAVLIGLVLVGKVLSEADWDVTALVAFGKAEPSTLDYAEERLGEVAARPSIGHDGRFFFIQANDPLLLDPSEHAEFLDRPTYRAQRMFYPLLAGLGGTASPTVVVWGLLIVNLLAIGGGTMALARYAQFHGMSRWLGLAFPLNPGLMSELSLDGAGVVAFALTVGAVFAVTKGRVGWAVGLLSLSALTREVMLVAAVGTAVWLWCGGKRRIALWHAAIPLVSVVTWAVYVRLRLPGNEVVEVQEIGPPFSGIIGAFGTWLDYPAHLAVGTAVLLLLLLFSLHMIRGRSDALGYASMGFVAVAVLLTQQVWEASFDITRAVAPVITALIVNPLLFGSVRRPFTQLSA